MNNSNNSNNNYEGFFGGRVKKNKFLGEGSYGCVYKPGISCNNRPLDKNNVTKITEIDFYSKNEAEVSFFINNKTKKFNIKNRFSPVIDFCKVEFNKLDSEIDLNKCNEFLQNIKEQSFYGNIYLNNKFFLFHSKYIPGTNIKKHLTNINNPSLYVKEYIGCFYYILNSLKILRKIKVCHNDLQNYNISMTFEINQIRNEIKDYNVRTPYLM